MWLVKLIDKERSKFQKGFVWFFLVVKSKSVVWKLTEYKSSVTMHAAYPGLCEWLPLGISFCLSRRVRKSVVSFPSSSLLHLALCIKRLQLALTCTISLNYWHDSHSVQILNILKEYVPLNQNS